MLASAKTAAPLLLGLLYAAACSSSGKTTSASSASSGDGGRGGSTSTSSARQSSSHSSSTGGHPGSSTTASSSTSTSGGGAPTPSASSSSGGMGGSGPCTGCGDITVLSLGSDTACVVKGGGARCWGADQVGQNGDGVVGANGLPVDVTGLSSGVASISAGNVSSCAVTTAGALWCWGANTYGGLGDGSATTNSSAVPQAVPGFGSGVAKVVVGELSACLLTTGGGVKCWGRNTYGEVGDGSSMPRLTPTDVAGLTSGVTQVSLAGTFACALTTAGGMKCWGAGALGNGAGFSGTPVDVTGLTTGVASITAGANVACAVLTAGTVKCWGNNAYGELGNGASGVGMTAPTPIAVNGLTGIASISAGNGTVCALSNAGAVSCWGYNDSGQCGTGTASPADVTTPTPVVGLSSGVTSVSSGHSTVCALKAGLVQCWGSNGSYDLGQPGPDTATPVPAML